MSEYFKDIPRLQRFRKERYQLIGNMCDLCEEKFFPPRAVCVNSHEEIKEHEHQPQLMQPEENSSL